MKISEALEWAADFAERSKIFEPPMKSNGYQVDGWKPPTPIERTEVLMEIASKSVRGDNLQFLEHVLHNLGEARFEMSKASTQAEALKEARGQIDSIYKAVRVHLEGQR